MNRWLILAFLILFSITIARGTTPDFLYLEGKDPIFALMAAGDDLVQQGKYEDALFYYHQAAALEPRDPAIFYQIGSAYYLMGEEEKAFNSFEHATEIDPTFSEAWAFLGKIAYETSARGERHYDYAIKYFNRALQADPNNVDAQTYRCHCLYRQTLLYDALECYDGVISKNPGVDTALTGKMLILHRLHRTNEALSLTDAILQITPGRTDIARFRETLVTEMREEDKPLGIGNPVFLIPVFFSISLGIWYWRWNPAFLQEPQPEPPKKKRKKR